MIEHNVAAIQKREEERIERQKKERKKERKKGRKELRIGSTTHHKIVCIYIE